MNSAPSKDREAPVPKLNSFMKEEKSDKDTTDRDRQALEKAKHHTLLEDKPPDKDKTTSERDTGHMKDKGKETFHMGRAKRICYLSPMRAAKVQASLRIRAVSPEPSLLAHTSSESRGTFRQKARSVAPLNGWACAVEICHDGMLEDTNSLGAAQLGLIVLSS